MPKNRPKWMDYRNLIAIGHDTVMAMLSFALAIYLRLGFDDLYMAGDYLPTGMLIFTLICLTVFLLMRQYKGMWRYASVKDLTTIVKSVTLAILIFTPVLFMLTRMEGYPRSAIFINWMVLIALLAGPRLAYRLIRDGQLNFDWSQLSDERERVLLIGGGDQCELFVRHAQRDGFPYRVVGILDHENRNIGRNMHGIRVYAGVDVLTKVVEKLNRKDRRPDRIILCDDELDGQQIRRLLSEAESLELPMARLPQLDKFQRALPEKPVLKPIAIEDLLGRPQASLNLDAIGRFLQGRRVVVTGAGGTIGSELVRQIAKFHPSSLILLDHSEFGLYSIDKEIETAHPHQLRYAVLADVRDQHYVETLFRQHKPEIIFHAAAIKHVPLAESNPHEAVLTNIIGTRNVADAAKAVNAMAMVMISTDKAVNPTSLMGATKRAAEYYCQAMGDQLARESKTQFMTVRFGNVLGSTGSVVPLFRKQLEAGGPITVTHPDMVRYFMTVKEAVQLVLQAAAAGVKRADEDDSSGHIFVLDMGEPVKIMELARQMIRLAGLEPEKDISIAITGLRPGEKLYEELFYTDEAPAPTDFDGIMLARPRKLAYAAVRKYVDNLERAAKRRDSAKLFTLLHNMIDEYRPDSHSSKQPAIATVYPSLSSYRHH